MKIHLIIDGRSKNKIIAQKVGIQAAQESFKKSLKIRSPLFSWHDEPVMLPIVLSELAMHYTKVPIDLTSLQEIVKTSCLIEYANLKEQYNKPLPVSTFNDDQIFASFVDAATHELLKERKKNNFSNFLKNFGSFDGMSLPEVVAQSYPVDDLKQQATMTLEKLFEKKSVSIELQESIRNAVDNFWKSFNILPNFK
jgi:hypothetical protein